jgi:hypothetical protein
LSQEPDAPASSALAPDRDSRVELISMLGLASSAVSQESSFSSSDSSVLRSAGAPQSNPDAMTSVAMVLPETMELQIVPEMAELQTQHQTFAFTG